MDWPQSRLMSRCMITPSECRAARTLIHWSAAELARSAGISVTALQVFESGYGPEKPTIALAVQRALELVGIQFTSAGVRDEPRV
jgi:transcriptional regulator with XRE-family HTH domain